MTKQEIRAAKSLHRQQKYGHVMPDVVDCGCVIHGTAYDWIYVERLYNMVTRHMPRPVRFHVWTEHDRSVPPHMIKHCLETWPGISGPNRSWWYKLQMFDPRHHAGDLLYFDLDVVIVADISWAVAESTEQFWTLRDFRYLQKPTHQGINSSMMWWNTCKFSWVWDRFSSNDVRTVTSQYPGDQDFLHATLEPRHTRTYPTDRVVSWRWQCHDGGWDFRTRKSRIPGRGTEILPGASVLVFHGNPKPYQLQSHDEIVRAHWK